MELESMKLAPSFDIARIEALKKGIPSPDEMTDYLGKKATGTVGQPS